MADPPVIVPIDAPLPPTPPTPPAAPLPPHPGVPAGPVVLPPIHIFLGGATGDRNKLYDAFYVDERDTSLEKSKHPVKSFFSIFTDFTKYDPAKPTYDDVRPRSAFKNLPNPLQDTWALNGVRLLQSFEELLKERREVARRRGEKLSDADIAETRQQFEGTRTYYIYVPPQLIVRHLTAKAGEQPKARITLYFGYDGEMNLFGLRSYFYLSADSILICIPGVEDTWTKLRVAWGIGISTEIINQLLTAASVEGMKFTVEVMAGYSTGYRGLNETIINEMVDLSNLTRLVYLDGFYFHDDFPLGSGSDPRFRRKTELAVDTALTHSKKANLFIYAYTKTGTPRDTAAAMLKGSLKKFKSRTTFVDVEYKRDGVPAIADQLEKICLARLIQGGIDDYFSKQSVDSNILALIEKLPPRGSFSTFGRQDPGFISVYRWINVPANKRAIDNFPKETAVQLVLDNRLLSGETGRAFLRHLDFVQEICKDCLLP